MTTIAFDGKVLATDSQVSCENIKYTDEQKLFRIDGALYAFAGDTKDRELFLQWIAEGAPLDGKPELCEGDDFSAVQVTKYGAAFEYDGDLIALPVRGCRAWGSGWQVAEACLQLGLGAVTAIETAIKLDCYTGGEVQSALVPTEVAPAYVEAAKPVAVLKPVVKNRKSRFKRRVSKK